MAKDEASEPDFEPAPGDPLGTALGQSLREAGESSARLPDDPETLEQNECSGEFNSADYEGRVALFTRTLEEPWMSCDLAEEMMLTLFDDTFEQEQGDRFGAHMEMFRQKRPDYYAQIGIRLISMQIHNAVVAGRAEPLPALVHELAELGESDIDVLNRNLSLLAYRGHLDLLLDARRTAWPKVRESKEVLFWGIDEFAERGICAELFAWLEGHPDADELDVEDPQLLARLLFYSDTDHEVMGDDIARMSGRKTNSWSLADFSLDPPGGTVRRRRDDDDDEDEDPSGREHLEKLTCEFLGYARREAGISWTQAELGRGHLVHYILDRHAGRLEESIMAGMMRGMEGKTRRRPKPAENVLCPDERSLDCYVALVLDPLGPAPADAAALLMLVPIWLRFLESRGLIDNARRTSVLQSMTGLADTLAELFEQWNEDPLLAADLRRWREVAGVA